MKTFAALISPFLLFMTLNTHAQETFTIKASVKLIGDNFIAILIDDSANFPGITETSIKLKGEKTTEGASFTFENVMRGSYSILVFRDENDNGTLDMDGGMPSEAFGYSNYVMMGPPTWKNCSFQMDEDKDLEINLYEF